MGAVRAALRTRPPALRLTNQRREALAAVLFILPNLVGFLAFTLGPVVYSAAMSLTEWTGLRPPEFIAVGNYLALAQDPLFRKAVVNTVTYTAEFVPLTVLCALGVALLLNRAARGIGFVRALYFFPIAADMITISFAWIWIYHSRYGVLNSVLALFGLPPLAWLSTVHLAMFSLVVLSAWRWMGYYAVILLAGLQGIPRELHEAATLDGAGPLAQFRYVTVPLLSPALFFVVVMGLISSFQVFEQMYVMTQGGPMDSTLSIAMILYQNGFQYFKMGYASAMAWTLFFMIFAVTLVQWRVRGRWVFEG
ncbi:MAG TPA: sugar ABC transporter permease [Candidatus Dormibacteraeota bacterium]|nr:sugar ABC transporter permease [Candidatus Dormibacteraeota bacterium]